jgi:predicted peroxiredoxin
MKLGILVNTESSMNHVIGVSRAALAKGHDVVIFTMDVGTRLLKHPEYAELCRLEGVRMSFCDHNAKTFNAETEGIPEEVVCGSQFDNAAMMHECDKVLVL